MHELESMFYMTDESGKGRPWHGLGVEVLEAQTSEEAIIKAGLNWEVEKRDLFVRGRTGAFEDLLPVEDHFGTVRVTDQAVLGVVGSRYTPLQNKSAFTFFDELIGSKEAIYETCGSLRGGKIIWIMSKLPGHIGWSEDPIEMYLILSNAHDGSRQVNVMASPVRVVCNNTLNAAIQNAKVNFEMRHTSGLMDRVVDAREALGIATDYFRELDGVLAALREHRMSEDEIKAYVHGLFPLKVSTGEKLSGFEDTLNVEIGPRIKKYIEKTLELTETGKGTDIPGVKGSAYGAFNAAVEFADHYQPVKGKNESMLSRKLNSIWWGSAARFKQLAFDRVCHIVQS